MILTVFGSIFGVPGDYLGMIWACSGGFPGLFQFGKNELYEFSKNRFFFIGGAWSEKNRKVRCRFRPGLGVVVSPKPSTQHQRSWRAVSWFASSDPWLCILSSTTKERIQINVVTSIIFRFFTSKHTRRRFELVFFTHQKSFKKPLQKALVPLLPKYPWTFPIFSPIISRLFLDFF